MAHAYPADDRPAHTGLPEPGAWLGQYSDALYGYALDRLRGPSEAEDAVQETLLAALKARNEYQGRAEPRTWLMAILKRKVADRFRAAAREPAPIDADDLDLWFDRHDHWRREPGRWNDPATAAERAEFWGILRNCLARLPARMAEAFTLRTLDEAAPTDVCRQLAISQSNLWVLLHRARLQLVRCLELHWFDVSG
jgi:RNA polymerase sigma-70 factor (ECF subfamily)